VEVATGSLPIFFGSSASFPAAPCVPVISHVPNPAFFGCLRALGTISPGVAAKVSSLVSERLKGAPFENNPAVLAFPPPPPPPPQNRPSPIRS